MPNSPRINLVVDEYHTYFVGKDRVLSFDNIETAAHSDKVPGFDEIVYFLKVIFCLQFSSGHLTKN